MFRDSPPVFRDVVLAGGGHTHALLIRRWGMNPLPGVRLTLVSPSPQTPYSGMLPGLIAGHYTFDDIHIDLVRLCQWAGVRFISATVTGIDLENNRVRLAERPPLEFDVLSLDTGSTPAREVAGVAEHAVPVKPIAGFWQRWQEVRESLRDEDTQQTVAVVGGGAGAVEIALAMAWACRQDARLDHTIAFALFSSTPTILEGYPRGVRKAATRACEHLGIALHESCPVTGVDAKGVYTGDGPPIEANHVFWCTQAAAPDWPGEAGLACNAGGFVSVNNTLQSTTHPCVFAAGDIAHMVDSPRPKAGVYAVRQAPVLYRNIRNFLLARRLEPYRPQDRFLSLLTLGDRMATGSRGVFSITGRWVWRWKYRIDSAFMDKFSHLPVMDPRALDTDVPDMLVSSAERGEILDGNLRCSGCGGKVGPQVLADAMRATGDGREPEDASIVPWPAPVLVQSVDQISAPFDDPWLFGKIAVLHALNDLLARNAVPHSIQVALTLPFAGRNNQRRELQTFLEGIRQACREESVSLLGGHTGEGPRVSAGITVNGLPGPVTYNKRGARAGDVLMLNKALGTGIVLAGHMHGLTPGSVLAVALESMALSNRDAADALSSVDVHACTDISGFGLLGHLAEMLDNESLVPEIDPASIPILTGVTDLAQAGILSSLHLQNEARVMATGWGAAFKDERYWPVLLDPQTSGPLLLSVDRTSASILEVAGFRKIGTIARAVTRHT